SHHDTPTTNTYTLSLHDALPISERPADIARAIGRLLDDRALAARLGAAARRRAVADFDIDGLLTREVDVVRAVARRDLTALFERSEEHTSELQSPCNLVCRLLLE